MLLGEGGGRRKYAKIAWLYILDGGMRLPIILSHYQVNPSLANKVIGQMVEISLDLGLSTQEVLVEEDGFRFPNGESLSWEMVNKISKSDTKCYMLRHGELIQIRAYSDFTDRTYSLMPTEEAPTLLVSGIPMHRIKGITPNKDTEEKVKVVSPIRGEVLDTTTGLGYTAIEASKTADLVVTIELDPAVLEVAQLNPWSQDLFTKPNITRLVGDSFDLIKEFDPKRFRLVIHDPPTFSLAGDLYSKSFYDSVYRVLHKNGCMFHYIGNPESRSGRRVTDGVIRRLRESGFVRIRRVPKAFGVVALK
jgi:predicted methyltransferase